MKIVDAKGLLCPKPLIMTKEALKELGDGDKIKIFTDNETSHKNLISFLSEQGVKPEVVKDGKVYTIISSKPAPDMTDVDPESYCSTNEPAVDYVICISSCRMGDGDPELGKLLMETFINNLNQQERLPSHILFYNEGVKLAVKTSAVGNSLRELEQAGTRIMVCGMCIEHYGLQRELEVGMISNMVVITETMVNAGHLIYP